MTRSLFIFGNYNQKQMLREKGDFEVSFQNGMTTHVTLAGGLYTAIFYGALDHHAGTDELTGLVWSVSVYADGASVAYFSPGDLGVELPANTNVFYKKFAELESFLFGSTHSTQTSFGSDGDDEFMFRGTLRGFAGDDFFIIQETEFLVDDALVASTENLARDKGIGGDGNDTIQLATDNAIARGDAGDDRIVAAAGRAAMEGGSGADEFTINNASRNDLGQAYLGDKSDLRVAIRDFTRGEDRLVFEPPSEDGEHDRDIPVALADLFGAGTLAGLSTFTHDGLDYRVMDPDTPHTVIRRTGEIDKVDIAEKVILRNLDPAEIDRAEIVVDFLLA